MDNGFALTNHANSYMDIEALLYKLHIAQFSRTSSRILQAAAAKMKKIKKQKKQNENDFKRKPWLKGGK